MGEEQHANLDAISRALWGLGTTPGQVAAKLKGLGCTGKPMCAVECPVAKYLKHRGITDVGVHAGGAELFYGGFVEAPLAVREFVIAFDAGRYPELEELPAR